MRLRRIRGQVQVREQQLPFAQHLAFADLRFLDLHDHVGGGKHLRSRIGNLRADRGIICVGKTSIGSCAGFNEHFMAMGHGLPRGVWGHPDPKFLRFDFFGTSDLHGGPPSIPAGRLPQLDCNVCQIFARIFM